MWATKAVAAFKNNTAEMRKLIIGTGFTLLGFLLQLVAVSTDHWLLITVIDPNRNGTGHHLVEAYTGLWRLCRLEVVRQQLGDGSTTESERSYCEPHNLLPSENDIKQNKDYDLHHLDFDVRDLLQIGENDRLTYCVLDRFSKSLTCLQDYTRTAIAFTIIALVLMMIGHCFALYTLRRPRYIIKRLTALLHFMTAACLLVLNEVFVKTVQHEKEHMPERIPPKSTTKYGFSFILSWIVFVTFVLVGMLFLLMSHKRKAEYADGSDAIEDEPMQLGRL